MSDTSNSLDEFNGSGWENNKKEPEDTEEPRSSISQEQPAKEDESRKEPTKRNQEDGPPRHERGGRPGRGRGREKGPRDREKGPRDRERGRGRDQGRGRDRGRDRGRGDRGDDPRRNRRGNGRRKPLAEGELFQGRRSLAVDDTEFKKFFLDENLLKGIAQSGYGNLTPLQEKMIIPLMERENIIIQASPGEGKTAGYLIPLLHTMSGRMGPRVLIITATRDIAIQVYNEARRLSSHMEKKNVLIDPGSSIREQADLLESDPEIVIGTPGRVLDQMRRDNLRADDLDCLVLDEVDRLLDQGQKEDLESILEKIPCWDQTITIASSVSPPVVRLCRELTKDGVELFAATEAPAMEKVEHLFVRVEPNDKLGALYRLFRTESPDRALVFCRNKMGAGVVTERIRDLDGSVADLHMGISHRKQDHVLRRFRDKQSNILVLTDTFGRDLEIDDITHVINYDLPEEPGDYRYRIGKTAHLKEGGKSIALVSEDEMDLLREMESLIDDAFEEIHLEDSEAAPASEPESRTDAGGGGETSETPESSSEKETKSKSIHGGWHRKTGGRRRR